MSMEYYTYGNLDIVERTFKTVAMMTGANSSFESLMIATSLLAFTIMLGMAAFRQSLMPLSSWFFGVMLLWYGMMVPKTDVIIVDQTNVTANRVVSNMPLGLAFMGNMTSTIGKWFTDMSDAIFTPINDISYSKTGLVFGANSYLEASKVNLLSYKPELQSDWTQYVSNCTFYDIVKYNKFTVSDLQSSTNILDLIGNTNLALPTTVHKADGQTETLFCDQAYAKLRQQTLTLTSSQNFLQRFAAALNPSGSTSSTMISQATSNLLASLEASYTNTFAGVQRDAISIITQEMMINVTKTAALQNAETTGDTEQMMAGLASAQAELQTVTSNNSSAVMAAKYLPIMHNLIEGIIIALFPIMIVMCIMGGLSMFNTVIGYLMSIMWVKLWPALFAMVNGIGNMNQASEAYSKSFGDAGSTLKNSLDMIGVANSTQALAGHMSWIVVALAGVIVMGMRQGLMGAFSSIGQPAQSAGSSAGSSVGAGNVSMGNASYNNTSANKDDRSAVFSDPGNMHVKGSSGWMQGNAGVQGSMRYGTTKNDLPVSSAADYTSSQQHSREAANQRQLAYQSAATAQEQTGATIQNAVQYANSKGSGYAASTLAGERASSSSRNAFQFSEDEGQKIATQYAKSQDSTTSNSVSAGLGATLSSGGKLLGGQAVSDATSGAIREGIAGNSRAGADAAARIGLQGVAADKYAKQISSAVDNAQKKGYSFDVSSASEVMQSRDFKSDLTEGHQLANNTAATASHAYTASRSAQLAYSRAQSETERSQESNGSSSRVSVDGNRQVGESFGGGSTPLGEIGKPAQSAGLAGAVAHQAISRPNLEGTQFDSIKQTTVNMENAQGQVDGFYSQASSSVESRQSTNSNAVNNMGNAAGLGGISQGIARRGVEASDNFRSVQSTNNSRIESGKISIEQGTKDHQATNSAIGRDYSMAQGALNFDTNPMSFGMNPVFKEAVEGLGGKFTPPPDATNFASNNSQDRTQDPKLTESTVVVRPWLKR
jgi:conjugal transfer mating pair stabilization protein TraG